VRSAASCASAVAEGGRSHAPDGFRDAVIAGLSGPQKSIPSKFLYDAEGSRLFELICDLPEYYPTRTELTILRDNAAAIAAALPAGLVIIEPGSGSSRKVRSLLRALTRPRTYVPVDISGDHLLQSAQKLADHFPRLAIVPVCADFMADVVLPDLPFGPRLVFFPGSTVGNLDEIEAVDFLALLARLVEPGGYLLIGVDLEKDAETLWRAYNDDAGITAAFNLNLLARINHELDASFDLNGFRHHAPYIADRARIEMHLVSRRAQTVRVGGRVFSFDRGETIHTENSHKYSISRFRRLAARAGVEAVDVWTDPDRLFSVHLFQVPRSNPVSPL
jgi:L-histidine Nalpha-methyltransferase